MRDQLPKALRDAQDKGIEFFTDENFEWKIEIEGPAMFIEEIVGCPVCVFANNGYGDYLFLKKNEDAGRFSEIAHEYSHEGPEIFPVNDPLEALLALEERPPSEDLYPRAVYETGEEVRLGDLVQVKVWAQFWKGWQDGTVRYVPGTSRRKPALEHGGLKWLEIKFRDGLISPLVDPETGVARKVRFVERGASSDHAE